MPRVNSKNQKGGATTKCHFELMGQNTPLSHYLAMANYESPDGKALTADPSPEDEKRVAQALFDVWDKEVTGTVLQENPTGTFLPEKFKLSALDVYQANGQPQAKPQDGDTLAKKLHDRWMASKPAAQAAAASVPAPAQGQGQGQGQGPALSEAAANQTPGGNSMGGGKRKPAKKASKKASKKSSAKMVGGAKKKSSKKSSKKTSKKSSAKMVGGAKKKAGSKKAGSKKAGSKKAGSKKRAVKKN
jgi:hypothetical protein